MKEKVSHWAHWTRPTHLINRASRLGMRVADSRLRPLGIVSGQLPTLSALRDKTSLSQKELAQLIHVEQPTMAQTLARMERDGLVQRQPDPDDKRSSLITLTQEAEAKIPQIMATLHQGNDEALAGFSDEEKELLLNLLRRVVSNLEAMLTREGES